MFIYIFKKLIKLATHDPWDLIDSLSPNSAFPNLDFDFFSDQGLRTFFLGLWTEGCKLDLRRLGT